MTSTISVRADVYTATGTTSIGGGPITNLLHFEYEGALDQIGAFSCALPATDPRVADLVEGRELHFYVLDEGLVFKGKIDKIETDVPEDGSSQTVVSGSSIARELAWNQLIGYEFSGTILSVAIDNVLPVGWSRGITGVPATTLMQRIDAASSWAAIADMAKRFQYHLRDKSVHRLIEVDDFGADTGIVLQNVNVISPLQGENENLIVVSSIRKLSESGDLWNSIVPWGGGEGINRLSLERSTRVSPYTINSTVAPDGSTFYYLEDATSIATYGRRRKVVVFKDIIPVSNSPAEHEAAANALYDVAVSALTREKDPQRTYAVTIPGTRHLNDAGNDYRFNVGDKFRLRYNGVATDRDGTKRSWLNVDTLLWLVKYKRRFESDGSSSWDLEVATIDKLNETGVDKIARALSDLHSMQVAVKPYTYREVHGPQRQTVDGTHDVTFVVDYDANVTYLHLAKLSVDLKPVRANATAAQSGGGSTSGSSSSSTTAGGSAHSHSVTATTSAGGSAHRHMMFVSASDATTVNSLAGSAHAHSTHAHGEIDGAQFGNSVRTTTDTSSVGNESAHTHVIPNDKMIAKSDASGSSDQPFYVLGVVANNIQYWTHDAEASHTHSVSGQTASSESSHTHGMSHTHSTPDHSHSLTFGIYEGSGPSNPNVTVTINGVDRTVALGGPFDNDFLNVDITQYLVDSDGLPLQQRNTIVFGSDELLDMEIVCKSIVTATGLVPV